ncbi:CRISPR-associated protein Cas4 [Bryobacter aggregatus]|uniref:CRISPR-associated protein Cas4 n=1 Tax=Bryobacter aggregatus TaxID=360054 RepID=UPI000569F9FC|nr:CRISPR-associated protein Cas4 [Bryobacter aggregatus]
MYSEEELLPLSGIQHFLFCPRQWALIHVEQQWAENRLTVEGRVLHDKVDEGKPESRDGYRIERSIPLRSFALGLTGKADVVEYPLDRSSALVPVEYKRGKEKNHDADVVQLCAQALCLEEMTGTSIPSGAIFYGEPRRRLPVVFDEELRQTTQQAAADMHRLFRLGETPRPVFEKKCKNCSLLEICEPKRMGRSGMGKEWESMLHQCLSERL